MHYLDNSATTCPSQAARLAAAEAMDIFGNPSAVYSLGVRAHELLENSRSAVAASLGIRGRDRGRVIFTSCGTEANCLALLGFACAKDRLRAADGPVILAGDGEHPSIDMPLKRLEKDGYRVIRIPTTGGVLDTAVLDAAATENRGRVVLAAFMLVNNETGALYDVKRASDIIKRTSPQAHVHCDAVQAFTKVKFTPWGLGADSLTVSAHKINAPRGAAALFIGADVIKRHDIAPILPGGGQEFSLRSGTENLCAIAAFAAACREAKENFLQRREAVEALRVELEEAIADLGEISIKRPAAGIPDIMNITLPRIRSETVLSYLSGRGVYVSAGSACSASSGRLSAALTAFGCEKDEIDSSIRISLGHDNTSEDIEALHDGLAGALSQLVRY